MRAGSCQQNRLQKESKGFDEDVEGPLGTYAVSDVAPPTQALVTDLASWALGARVGL
jgi:hypothetical protein